MSNKFKVLGLLSLPLAALAVAAIVLSMNLGSNKAEADTPHALLDFSLNVGACTTGSAATQGSVKCTVPLNSPFQVAVRIENRATVAYQGYDTVLNYSAGLDQVQNKNCIDPNDPSLTFACSVIIQTAQTDPNAGTVWPVCSFPAVAAGPPPVLGKTDSQAVGCAGSASILAPQTLYIINFTCVDGAVSQTLNLIGGAGNSGLTGSTGAHASDHNELMQINCLEATNTPLPTATSTPPPIPRVFKAPALQNVFMTRQGAKIPPARCDDGTDVALLNEQINQSPVTQNAKGEDQDLAAFEFEVRFDHTKVCVNLAAAGDWLNNPDVICYVNDKDSSTLEGIARIGCISVGKGVDTDGLDLATISVRPQPELYSTIRPNQDNGNVVQIMNQACELADEQGHAIPIFSCEDADITFRFLEGDVDGPDCDVDVFDSQQVAFRWGVNKGSLLYNSFMDLEPSGQVKGDGDIDIKDIQFVFGRFGSLGIPQKGSTGPCTGDGSEIWPPQPPVNPKA